MQLFNKNKVSFSFPSRWSVTEEYWDNDISTIALKCGSSDFDIDIYHHTKSKDLNYYIDLQLSSFRRALPFGYRLSGKAERVLEKAESQCGEILGESVVLNVQIYLFKKIQCTYKFFRIEHSSGVNFVSCFYFGTDDQVINEEFALLLSSYQNAA